MAATGLFSCGHGGRSSSDTVDTKKLDPVKNARSTKPLKEYIHTQYEYADAAGASLVIENSLPKSGTNYTDPKGKKYIYAVFFTRITNETADPFELKIDFPLDSFEFPSSSGNYMRLLVPSDTVTPDKEPGYDYGLVIKSFLDNNLQRSSSLKRTIPPKGSTAFYVVTLSTRVVNGTLRTGLIIKEQDLFYRINDKDIHCGKINSNNLRLLK